MIGPRQGSVGERQKRAKLQKPGAMVPDGDGGYTEGVEPLDPPAVFVRIRPASQTDLEHVMAGAPQTTATHLVSMPYHPGVTAQTQLLVEDYPRPDRTLEIVHIANPDERNAELVLVCAEILGG